MKSFDSYDVDDVLGAIGLARKGRVPGMGSFFFGLGIGVIGGCAAALLLAPYSGPETREKLLRATDDLKSTVSNRVGELTRGVNEGTTKESSQSVGAYNPRVGV